MSDAATVSEAEEVVVELVLLTTLTTVGVEVVLLKTVGVDVVLLVLVVVELVVVAVVVLLVFRQPPL